MSEIDMSGGGYWLLEQAKEFGFKHVALGVTIKRPRGGYPSRLETSEADVSLSNTWEFIQVTLSE